MTDTLTSADPETWPVVELTPAPEIFVDGYVSTATVNGVMKVTFFTVAHDPVKNETQRRIVLRLCATIPVVGGIQQALGQALTQMYRAANEQQAEAAKVN
jgi:hypothetical protein